MGLVTKTYTFTVGATIIASEHNSNFDTLYNCINGNIDNDNIKSSAAIVDSKLSQITTASKVSGAALTSLSSVPAGAGDIPSANMSTNACVLTGAQTVAGVKTFSDKPVLPATTPTGNEATSATYVDGKFTTLGLSKSFTSSNQTVPAAGSLITVAHGMSASPVIVQLKAVCTTTEGNWSVNDEIFIDRSNMSTATVTSFNAIYADSTNVYMRVSDSISLILANKTTGAAFVATAASWKFKFVAFA